MLSSSLNDTQSAAYSDLPCGKPGGFRTSTSTLTPRRHLFLQSLRRKPSSSSRAALSSIKSLLTIADTGADTPLPARPPRAVTATGLHRPLAKGGEVTMKGAPWPMASGRPGSAIALNSPALVEARRHVTASPTCGARSCRRGAACPYRRNRHRR